jgi:hypothetical protein
MDLQDDIPGAAYGPPYWAAVEGLQLQQWTEEKAQPLECEVAAQDLRMQAGPQLGWAGHLSWSLVVVADPYPSNPANDAQARKRNYNLPGSRRRQHQVWIYLAHARERYQDLKRAPGLKA